MVRLLIGSLLCVTGVAQQLVHSTHDWPNVPTNEAELDRWIDCKTPGDGRTYVVGTTKITNTSQTILQFSNQAIRLPPPPVGAFSGGLRQVAVLQIKDPGQPNGIAHQTYFYGAVQGQPLGGLSTYAHAVAVHPHEIPTETRVVACGVTGDQSLPLALTPPNPHQPSPTSPNGSGWIAVFDGTASLLWSYQFYGDDANASTVVTDVSIRVEVIEGVAYDVVTYCGASTAGDSAPFPSTQAPLRAFSAPTPANPNCSDVPTDGSVDNGAGQWDGFVGRMMVPHVRPAGGYTTANLTRKFHAIVGGNAQDTLLGIREIDRDQFVVVGETTTSGFGPTGNAIAPITRPVPFRTPATPAGQAPPQMCFATDVWSSFGTAYWFFADSVGNLTLFESVLLGSLGTSTIARDVHWSNGLAWIVGATSDPHFTTFDPLAPVGTLLAAR